MQVTSYTLYNGVEIEVLELKLKDLDGNPIHQIMVGKQSDYAQYLDGAPTHDEWQKAQETDNLFYCYVETGGKTFAELLETVEGRNLIKEGILSCDALVDETEELEQYISPNLPADGITTGFAMYPTKTVDDETERCEEHEYDMYSVYACMEDGREMFVADFKKKEMADNLCKLLNDTLRHKVNAIIDNGFIAIDVNVQELPKQLVESLKLNETYVDQSDLQEHLYSEEIGESLPSWATELKPVIDKMNRYGAAYFRIIPNPFPGSRSVG